MPQQLAVLGDPIAHSKSPLIHRAAYAELGLDWEYTAIRCGRDALSELLTSRDADWRGFSVTMPLKEEAHRLAAVLDPVARESGVVNTLLRLSGAAGWAGFNTDVAGLATAIRRSGLDARRTVVLGSGATAVSAVLAARRLGAEHVTIVARNAAAAAELVDRFSGTRETTSAAPVELAAVSPTAWRTDPAALLASATLVVSALPGPASRELDVPDGLTRIPLFDVAYDPWPSPLAVRWTGAGGQAHSGLGMLVAQALIQIRIFQHGDPDTAVADEDEVQAVMQRALDSVSMGE
ncbi:shikimate dehydrogenase [Leucobacter rhizosphaerae]|uniref:Shikimate dehydrogenase n=1 Tax=Leucobacter rhizosphaerae TaxID=2932245 RepID=A0ABY4FX52_9MICO|nr:shikimate dehydrogenase [Leucobacter rhizosphaerae]UOQ60811.1 shikimate dehydrogenase [Leucobacter rhizosphaerae]